MEMDGGSETRVQQERARATVQEPCPKCKHSELQYYTMQCAAPPPYHHAPSVVPSVRPSLTTCLFIRCFSVRAARHRSAPVPLVRCRCAGCDPLTRARPSSTSVRTVAIPTPPSMDSSTHMRTAHAIPHAVRMACVPPAAAVPCACLHNDNHACLPHQRCLLARSAATVHDTLVLYHTVEPHPYCRAMWGPGEDAEVPKRRRGIRAPSAQKGAMSLLHRERSNSQLQLASFSIARARRRRRPIGAVARVRRGRMIE